MAAKNQGKKQSKTRASSSAAYRRNRALKGYRRIDVILSPAATRSIAALEASGLTVTRAVCDALQALAKTRGLG